jgi:hypothetical protein
MRRVELVFKTDDLESDRKATCLRVLDQFQLPDLRLLCYFDDENPESLRPLGEFLCGLHAPVLGSGDLFLPSYVNGCFFNYSSGDIRFDNLVYLCGRATATDTGTVITLAHEIQHFVQYGKMRKIATANTLLYQNLRSFEPELNAKPWDIPAEREAMIVSKRIAENLLGVHTVAKLAKEQIAAGSDGPKWEFFLGLTASDACNLLEETDRLVRKYRPQLMDLMASPCSWAFESLDFSRVDWWLGQ